MEYDWIVLGAGPAGIAAVGQLIDQQIDPQRILWLDPDFTVGDFGKLWRNVPSNTKVKLFIDFLTAVQAFRYDPTHIHYPLQDAPVDNNCLLALMVDPLVYVTEQLLAQVISQPDFIETMSYHQHCWHLQGRTSVYRSKNVILAIGAEPEVLTLPIPMLPLPAAMDAQALVNTVSETDTVAVFGSSHSAILAIRNLVESKAGRVINFYRSPLRYAIYYDDYILFDDTGLKGSTAQWAKEFIDGELPAKLVRYKASSENIDRYLTECTKAVYAIGFKRRAVPLIANMPNVTYEEHTGIIAPGLFGLGIAFPEAKTNPLGLLEYRVGLWKFMDYLQRVLPIWLAYAKH